MSLKPNYIPKILIIDDEPFNLEFLELVLRQQGYKIVTANNGRTGIELAVKNQPDLILLDIMMPGETGFECATILRLSPETSEIPIIFLTALDDAKSTQKGFDAGAVDFITKPFEYREVLHRIRLHLKIAASDKFMMNNQAELLVRNSALPAHEENSPHRKNKSIFPAKQEKSKTFLYESVILPNKSESILLLNFTPPQLDNRTANTIRKALSLNTGPLYTPAETFRNVGIALRETFRLDINQMMKIDGIYAHINSETDSLTLVNAGSLPAILLQPDGSTVFIEPQSGQLGELGKGLLPCSTFEMKKNSRLFIYSREMLSAFDSTGKGIKELKEACELSAGVDIETACQAAGEMLLKGKATPEGILIAVEA
ncbi:Stage II sporulation protein E (SpoIIE) [Maridesulfovibrio ferrireducens]|uniref:Stage II sporulation protein E (SpoIIE) n=1 Tax=Maridesulfovibrio ferrireducens TaxID=246191 RepID=A0A1G9D5A8_9BACT|nr:response regulator [Maridesulfovibrio ferrireducens]SDK59109.1 Stage II sporulation protein E (SpoIIE) [Maridesulfovibrio ferrireducens]